MPKMLILAVTLLAAAAPPAARAGAVQVRITGAGPTGPIFVSLCTQAEYLHRCRLTQRLAPGPSPRVAEFAAVAPGRYAASVMQDANGNGRMDFGMSGQPSEPWGMSRGAKGVMGAPGFKDAVVEIGPRPAVIPVTLAR